MWGAAVEPRLVDQASEPLVSRICPSRWEGNELAFFADLQVGMWLDNVDTVRKAVSAVRGVRPAFTLIGGNFVYNPTEDNETISSAMSSRMWTRTSGRSACFCVHYRPSGTPVFAVLGNDDYGMMERDSVRNDWIATRLKSAVERIGVTVLDNSSVELQGLYVVGWASHFAGNDHPEAALAGVPPNAPRIVIVHHPKCSPQCRLAQRLLPSPDILMAARFASLFCRTCSWLGLVRDGSVDASGWISGYGATGNRLYINRGIAFGRVPVRINCRPELTVFKLRGL
jgi:hypothetical protein